MDNLNCVDLSPCNELLSSKFAHFLRIKPSTKSSGEENGPYKVIDSNILSVDLRKSDSNRDKGDFMRLFAFTELLDDSVSQKSVFSKCCLPLINDVLNGVNGLLFCIGQSYTMKGSIEDQSSDPGLVSLALGMIFSKRSFIIDPCGKIDSSDSTDQESALSNIENNDSHAVGNKEENISYQHVCYLSHFEIYGNYIYDLLAPSSDGSISPLPLFTDDEQNQPKTELQSVLVSSFEEAFSIYSIGSTNRQKNTLENIPDTSMSRRHPFFCISLIKFKQHKGKVLESKVSHLTLGDFSGYENNTQMVKILTKLVQLEDRFDLSKNTLKSLGDNRKVWMIVDIDPSSILLHKTLKCLQLGVATFHNLPSIFTDRPHRNAKTYENSVGSSDKESQTENLEFVPIARLDELKESYEKKIHDLENKANLDLEYLGKELTKQIDRIYHQENRTVVPVSELEIIRAYHALELKELRETLEKETQKKLSSIEDELTNLGKSSANRMRESLIFINEASTLSRSKDKKGEFPIQKCQLEKEMKIISDQRKSNSKQGLIATSEKENVIDEIIHEGDTIIVHHSHEQAIKELRETLKKENQLKLQSIYEKVKEHLNVFKEKLAQLMNIATDKEPQTDTIDCSSREHEPTQIFHQHSNPSDPEVELENEDDDQVSVVSLKRRRSSRSKCLQEITSQSNCSPDSVLESHLIEKKKKFCNSTDQSFSGSTLDENTNFDKPNSSLPPLPKYLPDSSNCGLENNEIW
ncbi:kinesin-like protein KIF23 [Panonychus citri]|uniref:kinesin-like protein KIF23 n=1 Tax=Panonychus citri TaxID=50023 RepID=UPI0023070755|nr:kinesin-like protein KIF23 [Panonychus citri]